MNIAFKLFRGKSSISKFLSEDLLANPQRMILLSFLIVILMGTSLLMIPSATIQPGSPTIIDALFTATSATCVTGLVVSETAQTYTLFGQVIILGLIQLGGLGIMTFSTFFIFLFVGKLSISGRDILIDTFSQNPMVELGKLIKIIFFFTLILEFSGWVLLSLRFTQDFPVKEAIYYGLFQTISAFCNAGFNVLEDGYYTYATDIYFNIVNILLIVAGGLGFIVILDISTQLKHLRKGFIKRLSLHSKIVLVTTGILLVGGTVIFYLLEYNNSLRESTQLDKITLAIFQSTTSRTAGFNTVSIESLTLPTMFILLILMFIGASPGSCGGGIKTTTFMLFVQNILKQFSNYKDINIYSRRVPNVTLSRAIAIVFFAIFTVGLFVFMLILSEIYFSGHANHEINLMDILFEVVSAFGTVGLSTGITGTLSPVGKIIITLLMYLGRLGPLTLVFALRSKEISSIRYMKEDILVG